MVGPVGNQKIGCHRSIFDGESSPEVLDGVTFVRGLVLGWMAEPEASYSQLRSCLATLGVDVTSQALFDDGSIPSLVRRTKHQIDGVVGSVA